MKNYNDNSTVGVGFLGLLGIVFITLKLCKVITWSWWWVTSPLWGVPAVVIVTLLGVLVLKLFACLCVRRRK